LPAAPRCEENEAGALEAKDAIGSFGWRRSPKLTRGDFTLSQLRRYLRAPMIGYSGELPFEAAQGQKTEFKKSEVPMNVVSAQVCREPREAGIIIIEGRDKPCCLDNPCLFCLLIFAGGSSTHGAQEPNAQPSASPDSGTDRITKRKSIVKSSVISSLSSAKKNLRRGYAESSTRQP